MSKETKKQLKKEIALDNMARELEKADNVLELMERHLKAIAEANAALHGDEEVIYSPLYQRIVAQRKNIKLALRKSKHKIVKKDADDIAEEK